MSELDGIIEVQFTLATAGVEKASFGVPLAAGYHTNWPERVRVYNSAADMLEPAEGFVATDPLYLAAVALKAQSPRVTQFKIGRIAEATTKEHTVTVVDPTTHGGATTDVEGKTYTITINGTAFTYLAVALDDQDDIATALFTAINLGAEPVTAANGTAGEVDLVADVAGDLYTLEIGVDSTDVLIEQKNTTTDPGIAASLNAILAADDQWYELSLVSQSEAEINAAAGVISATEKLFGAASADDDILDSGSSTDIASDLGSAARSWVMYSSTPDDYPAQASQGRALTRDPGSSTRKFKTLTGITPDVLSATQVATLQAKNANFYRELGGQGIFCEGTVGDGEYIDTQRGADWLKARMQERLYVLQLNNEKLPFTDGGIAQIVSEVRAQLGEGVSQGYLSPDPFDADAGILQPFTVTYPRAFDVPANDKAARELGGGGIVFQAKLAGAIHKIVIQGTISL